MTPSKFVLNLGDFLEIMPKLNWTVFRLKESFHPILPSNPFAAWQSWLNELQGGFFVFFFIFLVNKMSRSYQNLATCLFNIGRLSYYFIYEALNFSVSPSCIIRLRSRLSFFWITFVLLPDAKFFNLLSGNFVTLFLFFWFTWLFKALFRLKVQLRSISSENYPFDIVLERLEQYRIALCAHKHLWPHHDMHDR